MRPSFKYGSAAAVLVLAALGGALSWKFSRPPDNKGGAPLPTATAPPPLRAVPQGLAGLHAQIQAAKQQGNFAAAARLYQQLLDGLAQAWGKDSADLAPYVYNEALALKLAGNLPAGLAIASRGLAVWPASLQLRVFAATARAEAAMARGLGDSSLLQEFQEILREENLPRLRGLRIEPAQLFAQWALLLSLADQQPRALEAAERGLQLAPRDRRLRETRARLLAALHKNQEALPLLEELVKEEPKSDLEYCLGKTLLETGAAAAALERLSRVRSVPANIKTPAAELPQFGQEGFEAAVELLLARALLDLKRPGEARDLLLKQLRRHPESADALFQLEKAERSLGLHAAADAIVSRSRRLLQRDKLLVNASSARAAGFLSSVPYYRAQAALEVERTGEALSLLKEALALAPKITQVHLEIARVHALLGRWDLALKALEDGGREAPSPVLLAEQARLLALNGEPETARRLLASPEVAEARLPAEAPEIFNLKAGTVLLARRLCAHLELGEAAAAKGLLEQELETDRNAEETLLCRAEVALSEGDLARAGALLSGSFQNTPGGAPWAAALDALWRLSRPGDSPAQEVLNGIDPSGFLDHPRLFLNGDYLKSLSPPRRAAAAPWLEKLKKLHQARRELLRRMGGLPDGDVVHRHRELLALYREAGAERKARETAWFLVSLRPEGVEEHRLLLETLSAPEEAIARLAVLDQALKLAPADPEFLQKLAAVTDFLGKN